MATKTRYTGSAPARNTPMTLKELITIYFEGPPLRAAVAAAQFKDAATHMPRLKDIFALTMNWEFPTNSYALKSGSTIEQLMRPIATKERDALILWLQQRDIV